MDGQTEQEDGVFSARRCRLLAIFLIVGTALLRLAYLAYHCPLDLAPDEAHYWDWSRHPDWSYYSKGPGIAWLIRLSCELFGSFSVWLTGNEMLAVRFPAVVCGSLLLVSLFILTMQVGGGPRVALLVVAIALTTPAISAGSSLMTIDSPYTCCWGWALVLAHHAVFQRSAWAWWVGGLLVGLGILFKYTMIVWLPSLGCFLLLSREHRSLLWSRGFWILTGIAGLSSVPILIWNAEHEWVSFFHVSRLAGQESSSIQWLGPLKYIGLQCAFWLVFWFIVWVRAMLAHAPWKDSTPRMRYLWWMSAPMFLVFFAFALKTGGGEPNWPVTAYISGIVLGVLWMVEELRIARGWYRRMAFSGLTAAVFAGVLLVVVIHFSGLLHSLLEPFAGRATAAQPFPLRRIDPTMRLRGWRDLARGIDEVRRKVRGQEQEPILAAAGWSMPGLLGFYCEDHPVVYSLGLAFGDRRSQYDFWRPNPIWDAEQFAGRTFLIVFPAPAPDLSGVFSSIETHTVITRTETGQPVGAWVILVCRGYRGFEMPSDLTKNRHF